MKKPKERLIVALDVPFYKTVPFLKETPNVGFYKIGLQGLVNCSLMRVAEYGDIFLDLKLGGDIDTTIEKLIADCMRNRVKFISFVHSRNYSITESSLKVAKRIRGDKEYPKFLAVPALSNDWYDYDFFKMHMKTDMEKGFDGLVVSGKRIAIARKHCPKAIIVSPGIRMEKPEKNEHTHWATPIQAIQWGADYIVVGRPITQSKNPMLAADNFIEKIASV